PQKPGGLIATLLSGSLGLAALGTFYSGLTGALKARQVLLPLLLFPMLIPLLLASILATQHALMGDLMGNIFVWLKVIGIFDLVFLAACWMVWPAVIEG
ncbi:MAG: heme exporter protein CcmB, partial [Deltaproteobacteria bacterium]|nr:heme exporter protein CcmB [Deltaproteobacteria bacterium]